MTEETLNIEFYCIIKKYHQKIDNYTDSLERTTFFSNIFDFMYNELTIVVDNYISINKILDEAPYRELVKDTLDSMYIYCSK